MYGGDEDEHRLVDELSLSEQTQAEVDEDEVLAELGQHPKHVSTRPLCPMRHVVVGVVLEGNSAKQKGDDTCEETTGVSSGNAISRLRGGSTHHSS